MAVDLPCTAVPDRIGTPILGICNQIEKEMTQSFTEEKKGLDFSPRSGEATSGEK